MLRATLLIALLGATDVAASTATLRSGMHLQTRVNLNPIRRVITLLQMMTKKVTEEGKHDQELFDKYMCYCKTSSGDLELAVAAAEAKVPQLENFLTAGKAELEQLKKALQEHTRVRAEAEETLAKAEKVRAGEAADFAKESETLKSNIAALGKAVKALRNGRGQGFLQTREANVVRRLSVDMDLSSSDRDVVSSFLSSHGRSRTFQPTMEVVGILETMEEQMEKELAEITAEEKKTIATYEELRAAKRREVTAAAMAMENKLKRKGQLGVEMETMKIDLTDTSKSLAEDKKFLADLSKNCDEKAKEMDEVKLTRSAELVAIGDTIKMLNDDDALDLFKKAIPTPSLLQTMVSSKDIKIAALRALRSHRRGHSQRDARLNLIAMALHGKKVSFDKIVKMIHDMKKLLRREQTDDNDKKEYCNSELQKSEDSLKKLSMEDSDLEKYISNAEVTLAQVSEEIAKLGAGIKELDASVAEATSLRKKEHEDFKQELSTQTAAKQLLEKAETRLRKFYNIKIVKKEDAGEKKVFVQTSDDPDGAQSADEDDDSDEGDDENFFQLKSKRTRRQFSLPPPPPEVAQAYRKKFEQKEGVSQLMAMLIEDLDKEITQIKVTETDSQKEYESFVEDSADKRAIDARSLTEKEGAKAGLETELQKAELAKKAKVQEVAAMTDIIKNLHEECDWLLAHHEARQEARDQEIEALNNAEAVLSGADYSLLQSGTTRRTWRLRH